MHEDGKKILNLMFLPDETICVSNSKFGYHSIPLKNAFNGTIALIPPLKNNETWEDKAVYCDASELTLVALNPIDGYRRDNNALAYRNFLIELDIGTIDEQIEYINRSGMPYSAMIFSGNKSIHTLISLEDDMLDEKNYRKTAQWILNILPLADQNIKNPSRSIRIPGAEREKDKFQKLMAYNGKISQLELGKWLGQHFSSMPKERQKRDISGIRDVKVVKKWAMKYLKEGFPAGLGRNAGWFQIACEFFLAAYSEDDAIDFLKQFYNEEHDFKEKEWLSSIASAYKYMENKA